MLPRAACTLSQKHSGSSARQAQSTAILLASVLSSTRTAAALNLLGTTCLVNSIRRTPSFSTARARRILSPLVARICAPSCGTQRKRCLSKAVRSYRSVLRSPRAFFAVIKFRDLLEVHSGYGVTIIKVLTTHPVRKIMEDTSDLGGIILSVTRAKVRAKASTSSDVATVYRYVAFSTRGLIYCRSSKRSCMC